ncbi:MAG: sorbosone dehydrogenase family protein [Hyphomicrobiaceae bacterium]|nr:sorbosone dehydrogenase family protein [Hyphomicrobiaceae bacterium]
MRRRTVPGILLAWSLSLAGSPGPLKAQDQQTLDTDRVRVRVETIATGLNHPWGIALLPDGRYLVTERNSGELRIGTRGGDLSAPVEGVPDVYRYLGESSQGGLFHVALHPKFAANRLVYLSYSQPSSEGAGTAIARGRLNDDEESPALEDVEVMFSMNKHDSGGMHFGGRFVFDASGKNVFLSIGDRRNMSRAQDPTDHAGSIIRITDEGDTPDDNPFVDVEGKDDKIYAMGLRNVQGMAIHPDTGELWVNDHGPLGGDEINLVMAGLNYGWPFQTGGLDYSGARIGSGARVEGVEPPVHIWEQRIAPSGLAIYNGGLFAQWRGDLLHGGLYARGLVRTRIADGKVVENEIMLTDPDRRIRDVQVDADGAIWLITEHEDGEVLRLVPEDTVATGAIPRIQPPPATGTIPGKQKE